MTIVSSNKEDVLRKTLSNVTTRTIREDKPAGQGDVCEPCWVYGGVGVSQCEFV